MSVVQIERTVDVRFSWGGFTVTAQEREDWLREIREIEQGHRYPDVCGECEIPAPCRRIMLASAQRRALAAAVVLP